MVVWWLTLLLVFAGTCTGYAWGRIWRSGSRPMWQVSHSSVNSSLSVSVRPRVMFDERSEIFVGMVAMDNNPLWQEQLAELELKAEAVAAHLNASYRTAQGLTS